MSNNKIPVKREFSAGGCVYKKNGNELVWLVGKHSGYHKWVLPKGMIEEGEKSIETAVRETEEEMGVVAKVVDPKPIHKEEYWFVAEYKSGDKKHETGNTGKKRDLSKKSLGKTEPVRRVAVYEEDPKFEGSGRQKVRVFKTVSFYLMEYVSGDPKDHDWEMSDAGWYGFDEAMELLAFEGERVALRKANHIINAK